MCLLILQSFMLLAPTTDVSRHVAKTSVVLSSTNSLRDLLQAPGGAVDVKLCCVVTSCGGLRVTAPLPHNPWCQVTVLTRLQEWDLVTFQINLKRGQCASSQALSRKLPLPFL
ncbi:hypothetical protein EI94DRAFT_98148 [Lactarius quietus]|nr:hypothetical protein EI94DRAFT_98148 [Lactarius quietus]